MNIPRQAFKNLLQKAFLIGLMVFFTQACSYPKNFPQPENPEKLTLKVINYNVWHGLGGSGFFKRDVIEPEGHKEKRFQELIRLLKPEQADILFLQELNPVASQAQKIAQELGMSYVFQNTNCGISVLGMGFPVNLDMGIAILVRPPLQIKKIVGLKLSGPSGSCNPYLTFQYAEFRYALFALAYHPNYGSFVLANTHFHHGVEWSPQVRDQLKEWLETGVLTESQKEKLSGEIEKSNQRRLTELKTLFSKYKELSQLYNSAPFILAGDFNSTVDSPIYKQITGEYQLKDSRGEVHPEPWTWDPIANIENHKWTADFGISVPDFAKPEIRDFFKNYDRRQRRIDYIFVDKGIQILSYQLFAEQANTEQVIASDHFGIQLELESPAP